MEKISSFDSMYAYSFRAVFPAWLGIFRTSYVTVITTTITNVSFSLQSLLSEARNHYIYMFSMLVLM